MYHPENRYTEQQVADALRESHGVLITAARRLGCTRSCVWAYTKRYPKLVEIIQDEKEKRIDKAEGILWKKVLEGEPWAVIFFLKCQAKRRGYSERHEINVTGEVTGRIQHDHNIIVQRVEQYADIYERLVPRQEALPASPNGNGHHKSLDETSPSS